MSEPTAQQKLCPYCKEPIKAAALACRYCGRDVSKFKPIPVPGPNDTAPPATRWVTTIGPIVAVVCVIIFLIYYGVRIYGGW